MQPRVMARRVPSEHLRTHVYGGTQSEMQRLIKDASQMTDIQEKLGVTVDASSMSFDNIINAISVMQEHYGIAGTTAKEAASTIEGSVNTMKASWENFLTALGTGDPEQISTMTADLLAAIGNVAQNVAPRVAEIGSAIVAAMPEALAGMSDVLGPILSEALATAWNLAVQGLAGLGIQLPEIDAAQIQTAFQAILDFGTQAAEVLGPVVSGALQGLIDALTWLVENGSAVAPIIAGIAGAFAALAVIQTAVSAITAVGAAIAFLATPIGAAVVVIGVIIAVIVALATNAGGCRDQVVAAFQAVADFFSTLPGTIGGFVQSIIDRIVAWATDMGNKAREAGQNFMNGLKEKMDAAVNWVKGVPGMIVGALGNLGSLLLGAGRSIMDGFLNGLKSAWGAVKDFVGGIAGWIAEHKGPISYDARLLIPQGRAIVQSLLKGMRSAYGDVQDFVGGLAPDISQRVTVGYESGIDTGRYALAGASVGAAGGVSNIYNVTVDNARINDDEGIRSNVRDLIWSLRTPAGL